MWKLDTKEKYLLFGVLLGIIPNLLPSLPETKRILDGDDYGQKQMVQLSFLIVAVVIFMVAIM